MPDVPDVPDVREQELAAMLGGGGRAGSVIVGSRADAASFFGDLQLDERTGEWHDTEGEVRWDGTPYPLSSIQFTPML